MGIMDGKNDLVNIDLGIALNPAISFLKKEGEKFIIPPLSSSLNPGGFTLNIRAGIEYNALSNVINGYLTQKRFDIHEGFIKKHVIVVNCQVSGGADNDLILEIAFTGSHNGTVYFTGNPAYNKSTNSIEWLHFDYDLKTKDFLLKAAKWLFDKQIISEIKKHTTIDLTHYYPSAANKINALLNKEWAKGIKGTGTVNEIQVIAVSALPQHLLILSQCTGTLAVQVSEIDLNF
ncbi:MAG: DUF4403 family protein [Chitinophagaceae bacterium]